ATSMDVTLPMVEKFCGVNYVPLALAHGIILTIIVPIIVPILYASGV
ncbi:MAG: lysine exporter LysO family protein, partial [Spirochaetia bacterium]|nr:lysine exporter LysO family protein [Spirochaetia bacterium]